VHGGAEKTHPYTLTPHLRGKAQHDTQHDSQHDTLLVDVGAINAQKVHTRLGVLIDRNLPDNEKAAVTATFHGDDDFDTAVLDIVNAIAGIDDEVVAVQNKQVDRAIFITLKESYAAIYQQMRKFRLTWEPALNFADADVTYREFIRIVSPSIYLHVTLKTNAAGVLDSGLKPANGGAGTGISQGSVAAVRALNVAEAAGKSYVTRSDSEIRDYYGNLGTKQVLMIYICHVCEDEKHLHIDPDSQHGLYYVHEGWQAGVGKAVASKTAANDQFIAYVQNLVRAADADLREAFDADQDTYITQLQTFLAKNRD